jgi:hypothetical protein
MLMLRTISQKPSIELKRMATGWAASVGTKMIPAKHAILPAGMVSYTLVAAMSGTNGGGIPAL